MTTDRLVLEVLTTQENHFIFELVNSKGWLEFIGNRNVNNPEEAVDYIQKIIENPNVQYWVVKLKEARSSVGVVTLIKRDYLAHHDIGFAFLSQYMGHGYGFEAANKVLGYLVENANHTHILATTLPSNKSSIRLLERLGLQFDNEIEVNGGKLHVYSVAAETVPIPK